MYIYIYILVHYCTKGMNRKKIKYKLNILLHTNNQYTFDSL